MSQSLVTNTILQFANNTTNYPVSTSIGFLGAGTGNKYVIDPLFVNASDPDGIDNIFSTADDGLALQNCSPAINAGNNADNLAVTDITGATRIKNSRIDMGAYENGAVSVSLVVNPSGAFCFGTSRTFTATPTNGGTSPTYNFKVNGVSVQNNSSNIFTTTTLVNNDAVIVEMTSNLCSFTIPATSNSITMQVYALPTPTAGSNSPVCAVNTLNMTSSGGGTYAWTGPNRFSSTDQNLSFPNSTTSLSGTYIITVTNVNGCSATASTAVIVNALPISSAGNNSPICSGNTLNLTSSGGTSYAWTGPNNYSSSTQNPNFTNAISSLSGIYIVTVTNVTGCTATTLTTVTVNASPTPTAGSNSPICAGNTLNITSSGGGTYAWTGPNSFSSTTQNPGFNNSTVSLSGIYTVTITNTYGCTAAATTLVTVNLVPTLSAGIAINPTTVGGADGNIPFTTNLPNGTYSLSYIGTGSPKNIIVSAGIFTLNGLIAGVYSNFSITNNGCTGTDATSKTLNNPPIYVISIATGNWESSSTWDVGRIPQAGDTVIINTNHTVTLNGTGIAKNLEIRGIFRYNLVGSSLNLGL